MAMLEVQGLSVRYGSVEALRNVSFDVNGGEVTTLIGANGAEVQHEYGITLGEISAQNPVDSLVIAVGHQEFRALTPETLKSYCTTYYQPVVADLKTLYDRHAMADAGFTVFRF